MRRELWPGIVVALLVLASLPVVLPFLVSPIRALTPHAPILIVGDAAFTPANGVTGGSGTLADPYVIEGWDIQPASGAGILVQDTAAAFLIRNITVSSGSGHGSLELLNVSDGRVENARALADVSIEASSHVSMSWVNLTGSRLLASSSADVRFSNLTALGGVSVLGCSGVVFQDSQVGPNDTWVSFMYDPNDANRRGSNYTIVRNQFTMIPTWPLDVIGLDRATFAENEIVGTQLYVSNTRSSSFRNNTNRGGQTWDAEAAIDVLQSRDIEVTGNDVLGPPSAALSVELSDNITLSDNDVTGTRAGLALSESTNVTLRGNRVDDAGIWIHGSGLTHLTTHTIGSDNLVGGLPFVAYKNCSDVTVDGSSPVGGVFVVGCRRVHVRGLSIANFTMGIVLAATDDALVEGNNLTNIRTAIQVLGGTNVTVRGNLMAQSLYGLEVSRTRGFAILENTFDRNEHLGADVSDSADGRFFHNDFFVVPSAWDYGLAQGEADINVSWDDGYPSGGNYWPLYDGPDHNGDGIGDFPYTFRYWPGGPDRYPLMLPWGRPALPPVARMYVSTTSPATGETVAFGGSQSTDADGTVVRYIWDFGDGGQGFGMSVSHAYWIPGSYVANLTVTDNSGLTNTTSRTINVTGAVVRPTATFVTSAPSPLYPNTTVYFDARDSRTPYGWLVSYSWDFGDGSTASGEQVSHTFRSSGTYRVELTVQNNYGINGSTFLDVQVAKIPDIPLVLYSRPSSFRLPVPAAWGRSEDVESGDLTIDLVLSGPVHDSFQTNILVDALPDSSVREDGASMRSLVDGLIDDLRQDGPLLVIEEPVYRTISGHAGAVFAIEYLSGVIATQKFAIVVSEAHGTVWLLLLSVRPAYFPLYNTTFNRMVDGFEIIATPTSVTVLTGAVVAAAVVAVVVLAYVAYRRRSGKARASRARTPTAPRTNGGMAGRACARCGTRLEEKDSFCERCGTPARGPPPGPM